VTKRIRMNVMSAALATAVVAACGGTAGIAQDKVTLTYLTSQGWALDAHLALAEKFEEETGVAVDTQIVPSDQYPNVLRTRLNSGEGPDIFGSQSGLTEFLAYNVEKNAVDLSDEEWASRIDPLVAEQAMVNGKLYGLTYWDPLGLVWVVNYRKDIFAEHGLEVPTTYDELKNICGVLQEAGIQPIFEPISDGWHHVLWFNEIGPRYEELNPGLADSLNANEASFAGNEDMLTSLNQLKELYDTGCMGPTALSDAWADGTMVLATGEAAMAVAPLAYEAQIARDYPDFDTDNIGVFLMPLADNQIMNVNPGGPTMLIYSGSDHIEEAKQYFEFLTRPENVQLFVDSAPEALTFPFEVDTKFNDWQQAFMDKYKERRGIVYQIAVDYVNPQWMDIGRDITAMFTGAMTPEDVLENIDDRRGEYAAAAKDPDWE
jgi:raffinose/stachyose/melibiose transport system substrate-binding protein